MITDAILLLVQGVLEVILLPLTALNIGVDLVCSIPVIVDFVNVVCYILPISNLLPLIILTIGLFVFRINLAIVRIIKGFIPTMST